MSDARTVIANAAYVYFLDDRKTTGDVADAILAALAEAGLEIISTAKLDALKMIVTAAAEGSE
jgi:uncharacterized membrane protein YhfC